MPQLHTKIEVLTRILSFDKCLIIGPDLPQAFCPLECRVFGDDRERLEIVDVLDIERMLMHELKVAPHSLQILIILRLFFHLVWAVANTLFGRLLFVQVVEQTKHVVATLQKQKVQDRHIA